MMGGENEFWFGVPLVIGNEVPENWENIETFIEVLERC